MSTIERQQTMKDALIGIRAIKAILREQARDYHPEDHAKKDKLISLIATWMNHERAIIQSGMGRREQEKVSAVC